MLMKKFLLSIAVAFLATSAFADTALSLAGGWRAELTTILTGDVEFKYKNSYAQVNLISEEVKVADIDGFELVLSDDTPFESLQYCVKTDLGDGWSGGFSSATPGTFIPEGATTFSQIAVQACNVENLGKVEIVSFKLIMKDGSKVQTIYQAPASWAADIVTPVLSGTVKYFEGEWGAAALKGAENMENVTISIECEPAPAGLQFKVKTTERKDDGTAIYMPFDAGVTTASVAVAPEDGKITEVSIQNTSKDVATTPTYLVIKSAVVKDASSAISNVTVASEEAAYDLFGNPGATQGFMVKGGKKVYVK